jgi:hypothetical protein
LNFSVQLIVFFGKVELTVDRGLHTLEEKKSNDCKLVNKFLA